MENGKLLTVEDDFAKGQEGLVTASKDEPFGWFVKEIFHLTNVQTAEAAITEQHGICADVSISAWNGAALCFDELGRLSVAKREDQVLDDRIGGADRRTADRDRTGTQWASGSQKACGMFRQGGIGSGSKSNDQRERGD